MKKFLCTALLLLTCGSTIAFADDVIELDRSAHYINSYGTPIDREPIVLQRISTETGVPIEVLRTQRTSSRLGYGELLIANSLASSSGRSVDEIFAKRASGEGWGRIAQDYGQKLGPIVSRAHHAEKAFRTAKVKKVKGPKTHGKDDRDDDGDEDDGGNGHGPKEQGSHGHGRGH